MEKIQKIGAAYIRVSDERQDEYSPDSQIKKIREHAAKEGYTIPEEYVFYDDGISGKSARKRGDFNRMIALAKEKERPFDVIFVWKFSRFARNQEESIVYKNLLGKFGVSVVSVSEAIPDGPFGTLIERIIEWMDEFYLINLGAEVTRGMTEKATRGEPTCAPPFGYIIRDKKYYPDEDSGRAQIVREVFRMYANGKKQREIAVILGERGVRTKYGNLPDNRFIEYMLNNPCYIGKIRWSLDGERAVSRRDYDNTAILTVDGHHEPLISTELWLAVQNRLATQKAAYPKYARREQTVEYSLKGLVRCSACGGTLIMSSVTSGKHGTRTLQCHNYAKGSCHVSHSVTLPRIEDAVLNGLKQAVDTKSFPVLPISERCHAPGTLDYARLIAADERRLVRAKEAYLAEIDTLDQYRKNKTEIEAHLRALKEKQSATTTEASVAAVAAFARKVLRVLTVLKNKKTTAQAKNEALRTVVEKIIYQKEKQNVAIFFLPF